MLMVKMLFTALLLACVARLDTTAQAPPKTLEHSVAYAGDTARVTLYYSAVGRYDSLVPWVDMASRPRMSDTLPAASRTHVFTILRGVSDSESGEACVATLRIGRALSEARCQPVTLQWPPTALPVPILDSVTVEMPDTIVVVPPPLPDTTSPPPAGSLVEGRAELPRVYINTSYPMVARSYRIGASLQVALDTAKRGDRLLLAPDAVYTGKFRLPEKAGTGWIVVETDTPLPAQDVRVDTASATHYAEVQGVGVEPALQTVGAGSSYYRFVGVKFTVPGSMTSQGLLSYVIVKLGMGNEQTVAELASHITFDRVWMQGHDSLDLQRCLSANAIAVAVINSRLAGCHMKGPDSQAIVAWNTPGPLKIVNNYLEGAGENVMIGGSDPAIDSLVTEDIEIRRNYFVKPDWWKDSTGYSPFTEKNLFELKCSRRTLVEENVFDNNWKDAQVGFGVVLKSSNQGGGSPWCVTEHVVFRWNEIRNSPSGFSLHRLDDYEHMGGIPMNRVVVTDNLITGSNTNLFGAPARNIFQVTGAQQLFIARNTGLDPGNAALLWDGVPSLGMVFKDNLLAMGKYGVIGSGKGVGMVSINYFMPDGVFTGNVLIGSTNCSAYPVGTTCLATAPATSTAGVDRAELMLRLEGVAP